jgi:hypothetical protein
MNRKKKIQQILTKKMKKANAKLAPKDAKPAYVSKSRRTAEVVETAISGEVESKD